jgi:hypothetical protein
MLQTAATLIKMVVASFTASTEQHAYQKKKSKLIESWALLREQLVDVAVESACPPTQTCTHCGRAVCNIIICRDCSSMAYYCEPCFRLLHKSVLFHTPQIWKVLVLFYYVVFIYLQ